MWDQMKITFFHILSLHLLKCNWNFSRGNYMPEDGYSLNISKYSLFSFTQMCSIKILKIENFSISKTNVICAESMKVLHYSKCCMSCACGQCKSHVNRTELFDKNFKLLNKCFSYFKDGHTNPVISGLVQFQPCNHLLIL
jgi:hypothetical protein